jgi:hypothetical protein
VTADLVAFLTARLDEDRKIAFEAGNGGFEPWTFDPELTWESEAGPVHGKYGSWNGQHIARHDPARVLAEVDAKRRILNEFTMIELPARSSGDTAAVGAFVKMQAVLRLLALPYADHPDYRPEWAPSV